MAQSIPGRRALVKVSGAAVVFAAEASTDSGDHKTYQINNTAKRVWDPQAAITVKIGGVVAAEAYTLDRLTGKIIFAAVNAGRAAVTVDGSYLPLSVATRCKAYSWSGSAGVQDDTDFDTAGTNGGFSTKNYTQNDLSGSLNRRWSTTDTYFNDTLLAGVPVVIAFYCDRAAAPDLVCWALFNKKQLQAAVDSLVEESVDFSATPDADGRVASY